MHIAFYIIGGFVVLVAIIALYVRATDPANVDEGERESVDKETPEERVRELRAEAKEHAQHEQERREEEIEINSHE